MLSEKDKQENDKNMRGGGSWEAFKKRSLMISSHRKWPDMANGDTIKAIRSDILSRTSKHRRRRKKLEWHTIWWTGKSDDVTPVRANGKNKKQFRYCCFFSFSFSLNVIAVEFFPGREFVTMRRRHRKRAVSDGMTMTSRWVAGWLMFESIPGKEEVFLSEFRFYF
jgi:hypothetical protein